jgi:hypothetical protein
MRRRMVVWTLAMFFPLVAMAAATPDKLASQIKKIDPGHKFSRGPKGSALRPALPFGSRLNWERA